MKIFIEFNEPKVKVSYRKLKNIEAGRIDVTFPEKQWDISVRYEPTGVKIVFFNDWDASLNYLCGKDRFATLTAETPEEEKILKLPFHKCKNTVIFLPEGIEDYYSMEYIKNW